MKKINEYELVCDHDRIKYEIFFVSDKAWNIITDYLSEILESKVNKSFNILYRIAT